jgi:hypothetical protein
VGVATGLQAKFSFAGVAASAIGDGVTGGLSLGGSGIAGRLGAGVSGLAGDIAGAAARSLIEGSDFGDNIIAGLPGAIGATIGQIVADGVQRSGRSGGRALTRSQAAAAQAALAQGTAAGGEAGISITTSAGFAEARARFVQQVTAGAYTDADGAPHATNAAEARAVAPAATSALVGDTGAADIGRFAMLEQDFQLSPSPSNINSYPTALNPVQIAAGLRETGPAVFMNVIFQPGAGVISEHVTTYVDGTVESRFTNSLGKTAVLARGMDFLYSRELGISVSFGAEMRPPVAIENNPTATYAIEDAGFFETLGNYVPDWVKHGLGLVGTSQALAYHPDLMNDPAFRKGHEQNLTNVVNDSRAAFRAISNGVKSVGSDIVTAAPILYNTQVGRRSSPAQYAAANRLGEGSFNIVKSVALAPLRAMKTTADGLAEIHDGVVLDKGTTGRGLAHVLIGGGELALIAGRKIGRFGRSAVAAERTLLSNAEVRTFYNQQLKALDTSGPLSEATAMRVHDARNALKLEARDLMSDRAAAAQLARERPVMPFEYYVDKYSTQGYKGDALWQRIIKGSTTPNPAVNSKFGIK